MTTTLRRDAPQRGTVVPPDQSEGTAVPAPPKARRRWGMLAAMATLVCVGVLGNVWLLSMSTSSTAVVAARYAIERGQVITQEDLMTVQIGGDPGLRTVPATQLVSMVGQRAAVDVAAGSLLTPASTTAENLPDSGYSLVGVPVPPGMTPGTPLLAGDKVRVVATPAQVDDLAAATAVSVQGVVVSAQTGEDVTGQGAPTVVTVQVPRSDAEKLAEMAGTGQVAVVLDSRDR